LCRDYYPSQIKRKLAPAHEELIQAKFLTSAEYARMQDGEEMVVYHFPRRAVAGPGSRVQGSRSGLRTSGSGAGGAGASPITGTELALQGKLALPDWPAESPALSPAHPLTPSPLPHPAGTPPEAGRLVEQLVEIGMTPAVAAALVA